MGRKKIEIQHIPSNKQRNLTFKKRVKGLLRKTAELSILCGVNIKMKIKDQNGRPIQFMSSTQLKQKVEQKQIHQLFTTNHYPDFSQYLLKGSDNLTMNKQQKNRKNGTKIKYYQEMSLRNIIITKNQEQQRTIIHSNEIYSSKSIQQINHDILILFFRKLYLYEEN